MALAREGDQEFDEVRDFAWLVRSTQRNAAERSHDDLLGAFRVDSVAPCNLRDQANRTIGLDPAR